MRGRCVMALAKNLGRIVETIAGVQHAVDFRAVLHPLLDLEKVGPSFRLQEARRRRILRSAARPSAVL